MSGRRARALRWWRVSRRPGWRRLRGARRAAGVVRAVRMSLEPGEEEHAACRGGGHPGCSSRANRCRARCPLPRDGAAPLLSACCRAAARCPRDGDREPAPIRPSHLGADGVDPHRRRHRRRAVGRAVESFVSRAGSLPCTRATSGWSSAEWHASAGTPQTTRRRGSERARMGASRRRPALVEGGVPAVSRWRRADFAVLLRAMLDFKPRSK